jgi:hypothetical protein
VSGRQDGVRRLLQGHANAEAHSAQLGRLLPAVAALVAAGVAEALEVASDALTADELTRSASRRAARLVEAFAEAIEASDGAPACPCGSRRAPLRRFGGQGERVCPKCYMRQRRAA